MPRTAAEGAAASMGRQYGAERRSLSSECCGRYLTNADAPCAAQYYDIHHTHISVGDLNETSLLKARGDSFWSSLKAELTRGVAFLDDHALRTALRQYIRYYNRTRLHSSLNYTSPIAFERRAA